MNRILIKTVKFLLVLVLQSLILTGCSAENDWRTASRESAGLAPDPAITSEAVLQVYGAKAWGWRGWFALHTWIAAALSTELISLSTPFPLYSLMILGFSPYQ